MAVPLKICIKAISLSCVSICEDTILWDSSSNGAFDPKNAYSIAAGNVHQPNLFKGFSSPLETDLSLWHLEFVFTEK
ncbi:hypothetical protein SO802_025643 [Lithocarpus litseifolius]|uniref:Uncharacterized protein n=1 Tax=Lithocarpus litseifolius TaxID=425828 RepID=A0AAW2BYZ5_9ROSI